MSDPDSEEHVSIHRYVSEEIRDVIDRRRPTQGSAAPRGFFFNCIKMKVVTAEKMLQVLDEEYGLRRPCFNTSVWE